ncbi:PREDICTED: protein TIFY 6A isoform X2 [Theobroma cacao]|uniref:Protein TIFY n=2 Tax=Theobroma cacao TaxID=3641 RepID=A0AB32W9Z8_THECC|nr:PREDICTED: protein TIFY 6A isoform X2 [Theobroma cacao]
MASYVTCPFLIEKRKRKEKGTSLLATTTAQLLLNSKPQQKDSAMERDFLGLKRKDSSGTLTEIASNNIFNDSVGGMQRWWSEDSSWSQFQPFGATQDDMPDTLASPVYAFDFTCNPLSTLPKEETIPTSKQFLGGFPFAERSATSSPTDPRNKSKQVEAADDRLTIVYDNKVHVFEDVSPNKAEAILRLARDEYYSFLTADDDRNQVVLPEQTTMDLLCWTSNGNQHALDPPSIINSSAEFASHTYSAITLPQARKATLEHFLEKRKDRLTNGMFYKFMKTVLYSPELLR